MPLMQDGTETTSKTVVCRNGYFVDYVKSGCVAEEASPSFCFFAWPARPPELPDLWMAEDYYKKDMLDGTSQARLATRKQQTIEETRASLVRSHQTNAKSRLSTIRIEVTGILC